LELKTTQHEALVKSLIQGVSAKIESYLDRHVQQTARTDYFDAALLQRVWWLKGYPVATSPAPVLTYDTDRSFSGVTAEDSADYYVESASGRVRFEEPLNKDRDLWPGALKVASTGGMAPTLDRLSVTLTGIAGAFAVGNTVVGGTSGAAGTITAYSLPFATMTIQVTGGEAPFEVGEVLTGSAPGTATLATITSNPLVQLYPDVVEACNLQVAFVFQRRDPLGVVSLNTEAGSIQMETPVKLIPLVKELLAGHRNVRAK